MRVSFIEKHREDLVTNDGYVIVDFLNPDELNEVRENTRELGYGIDNSEKLRISINQESVENKKRMHEKLHHVFQNAASKYLRNYDLIRISIFDKLPGGGSIRVHQHPHLVDESKYRTLTIWVPLSDTSVEAGTLHVVKGSHNVFVQKIRTHNDYNAFKGVTTEVIEKYSTPILLKPGQAIIFDDRLIHWSPPNKSSGIRTAFQLGLVPLEIDPDLVIYYRENRQEVFKYAIDRKTFREIAPTLSKPDNVKLLGTINQPYINYGNRQFISMMRNLNPDKRLKKSIFQRFFKLMS